jgi:hypothetical protein
MATLSVLTWIGNACAALCGSHGSVTAAAHEAECSRQSVYDHADKVRQAVEEARLPGPSRAELLQEMARLRQENRLLRQQLGHAQRLQPHALRLDRPAQQHFATVAHAMGLSFNQIEELFALLFRYALAAPPTRGPGRSTIARWVHQAACRAGKILAVLDPLTRPLALLLALDEIFFHGQPVLMAVEPHGFALLLCQRGPDRTGATWLAALRPFGALEYAVSDQGSGLQAGLAALRRERQAGGQKPPVGGLDLFHIEQEAQKVLSWVWRKVEAKWEKAEAADRCLARARGRRGPLAKACAAWRQVESDFAWHGKWEQSWRQARQAFELFRPDGRLNGRAWARKEIEAACRGMTAYRWRKVVAMVRDERSLSFLDRMHEQLRAVVPQEESRDALVELWRLSHGGAWTSASVTQAAVQQVICARLDAGWLAKYEEVKKVLGGVVRASSAVECVNSVLRMQQARHRNVSQGMLDLKRLYWNTRAFRSGKRRDRCPYQLLGAKLPTFDFWKLLQHEPEKLAQQLSSHQLAA